MLGKMLNLLGGPARESHMAGALLASLEAGWCMPTACSLAEKEHLGKPGTTN